MFLKVWSIKGLWEGDWKQWWEGDDDGWLMVKFAVFGIQCPLELAHSEFCSVISTLRVKFITP